MESERSVFDKFTVAVASDLMGLVPILLETMSADVLTMRNRMQKGDYDGVARKAHSSRGAAMTYGFDHYADLLHSVELYAARKDAARLKGRIAVLNSYLNRVEVRLADCRC